ncbi:MAG: IS4 family transposase [Deltaproteobacteria bacterium]|nr:IS4 family transposase [Deltaproteobacteria bacterium]
MSQANVFEQVIKHISRKKFEESAAKHRGDFKVTQLDSWTWFGALLFGQLTGHDSIRAIERVFCQGNRRMQRLGFSTVCRSTLSDANQKRPLEILEDTLQATLQRAKLASPHSHGFSFRGHVLALDSTIIALCLSLSPWANFRKGTAAVKLHTAIDIAGDLPEVSVITPAICHDLPVAREQFRFRKGSTVIFDRAYWGGEWFNHLDDMEVFFVTRIRRNKSWKVLECRPTDRTRGFLCDQTVYQKKGKSRSLSRKNKRYRGRLRRISYRDPDTKKKLIFLTNRFDLTVETVAALYKARWKVELFFKTLKQNLRIKKFLGTSFHAVKAQIYIALIAYLLVQLIRWLTKSSISMPDAMAAIGTLLLLREPLERLLGDLPRVTRHPPDSQLCLPI